MIIISTGANVLHLSMGNTTIASLSAIKLRLTSQSTSKVLTFNPETTPTFDKRVLSARVTINTSPYDPDAGRIDLTGPDYPDGWYLLEVLEGETSKAWTYCYMEATVSDDSYRVFTPYNDDRQYKAYE